MMRLQSVDGLHLPSLEIALADRGRNAVGALGERWAAAVLAKSGYVVQQARRGQQRGDLRVTSQDTGEVFRVEVKTARRCKDKKWRFLLWKKGEQDHRHADVVIFLAVLDSGYVVPFVVRTEEIADQNQAVITSHPLYYRGKLARFRQHARRLTLPTVAAPSNTR